MCKATVIFEEKLGKRREGWCVYLNQSRDFTWYSDKQIKTKIAADQRRDCDRGRRGCDGRDFHHWFAGKDGACDLHADQGGRGQRRIEVFRSHPSYQGRQGWRPL